MNDANVNAPPETDIRKGSGAEGGDAALRRMSTKEVKKLFNHSSTRVFHYNNKIIIMFR